jgi:hypothetical protein
MRCSYGSTVKTYTTQPSTRPYHYYFCARRRQLQKMCDCKQGSIQARKVEPVVWEFISGLLKDPKRIERGIQRMITLEREGAREDPEREVRARAEKLAEADRKRSRYQDMTVEGLITFDELRAKSRPWEGSRGSRERTGELEESQRALGGVGEGSRRPA